MQLYIRPEWRLPAVGVGSFIAGIGVGYFVRSRIVQVHEYKIEETVTVDETIDDELVRVQLAKDFVRAASEQVQPRKLAIKDLGTAETENSASKNLKVHIVPDPPPVEDDWDQEEEEENRSPNAPYVLHREEFYAGKSGFDQACLEYFASDDVLCDENRVPVYNANKIVGRLEFGRASGDPNVVYIRNEELKAEYEITRNEGSYQAEVLGLEVEAEAEEKDLRHSQTIRKFRRE